MSHQDLPEPSLLTNLLEPLLEDFQYWFDRSRTLLERDRITFLDEDAQAELLSRVIQAQREVSTSQMLFKATGYQAGVEMSVLMPWHNLLVECWKVSARLRAERNATSQG